MNEAQRAAVLHGEGPLLLLAGPGSGKTFTITNRILYLMEQGAAPEKILVITFMKEAALSMQERFGKMAAGPGKNPGGKALGPGKAFVPGKEFASGKALVPGKEFASGKELVPGKENLSLVPVNFGTFHSVFYHILRESQTSKSQKLLSNSEKKNLMLPILKKYVDRRPSQESGSGSWEELGEEALQILSAVSYYKNTMNMEAAAAKAPAGWQTEFETVCREYERAVRSTGGLDFDDMLFECKRLLEENPAVRSYWQKRFLHILIDEFQDINPVQYEAVKLLAAEPYNIFAVGDDDQAIYGFRGSEPQCLKRFVSDFGARKLLLDLNYRSLPEIVQASLAVIGENKDRFVKVLKAAERSGTDLPETVLPEKVCPVLIKSFENGSEQYEYMIAQLKEQGRGGDSCAVLFRTNSGMQEAAARLKAADIACEMKEKAVSIYRHFIVRDIVAYLQAADGKASREQMLRIINRPSRYVSREALAENASVRGIIKYYENNLLPWRQREKILESLHLLERQLEGIRKLSLLPAVNYILKAAGYEKYLRELAGEKPGKWEEWRELLEWLKEEAGKHRELYRWLEFQKEYEAAMESTPGAGRGEKKPCPKAASNRPVQLLTVHGAKGLEYDRVWIPDCNEGIFPYGRMPDEKSVEEERRIFYVAMTRAKKSLELLCLTGTKERPRLPSRFLNPL